MLNGEQTRRKLLLQLQAFLSEIQMIQMIIQPILRAKYMMGQLILILRLQLQQQKSCLPPHRCPFSRLFFVQKTFCPTPGTRINSQETLFSQLHWLHVASWRRVPRGSQGRLANHNAGIMSTNQNEVAVGGLSLVYEQAWVQLLMTVCALRGTDTARQLLCMQKMRTLIFYNLVFN